MNGLREAFTLIARCSPCSTVMTRATSTDRTRTIPFSRGLRADVSYTLFLSDTTEYDGGGLQLGPDGGSAHRLPAGGLILYDSGTPHQVETVTRGTRLAAVGWIQSVIRDPAQRELLGSFYRTLSNLDELVGSGHPVFQELNRIRNQLMRRWTDL